MKNLITVLVILVFPSIVFGDTYMHIYKNWDAPGRDYKVIKTTSLDGCKLVCNNDNNCVAFTLNKNTQKCWLKSTVGSYSKATGDVFLGVKTIKFTKGVDRAGMDYHSFKTDSVVGCSQLCYRDKPCKSFTYNPSRKMCWLKSGVPIATNGSVGLSGVK